MVIPLGTHKTNEAFKQAVLNIAYQDAGGTRMDMGMILTHDQLKGAGNDPGNKPVMLLLTDGKLVAMEGIFYCTE